ncbi:MAG: outer membrane protein assembly factor BamD [Woeseiaceae bacterium]|jgi:outer membrane protein assembly factor BamD|nr:outer membrane protein assembly factor BamD [Woeseiaceae bacterium]
MQLKLQLSWLFARYARLFLLAILSASLLACGGNDEQRTEVEDVTESYETAKKAIENSDYQRGIMIFETIQARFPFSDVSRQIQMELLHAYYKSGQCEQALDTADTFIRENPIHDRVDYALYIKGLCYFEKEDRLLERWFRRDTTTRPPGEIDLAYSTFRRIIERFPDSEYSADAQQRIVAIKERKSIYANHIADYYLRRGAYVAAINRAKSALEEFNGTSGNAESLQIMAKAYDALGMNDLRDDVLRVLATNFPNDESHIEVSKPKEGFIKWIDDRLPFKAKPN